MNAYLEHANITVPSIDEATRILGAAFPDFRIRGGGEFRGRRWVHFGNDTTYMALNEYPEGKASKPDYSHFGVNHIGFVVKQLDELDQRLKEEGYKLIPDFQEEGDFRRRHYYCDGNGMEWEFIEYATEDVSKRNHY
ncbi:VOC family protein [Endozoicomonas sp. ALD040]|uniref:VOC family protein n=1 Tax=unclassified Endozoicomonas TaxID=2644528 RepID=UPI003BAEE4C6